MITQVNAEIKQWASQYKGAKFHALLSDPPYHLTSINKRFGKPDSAPAKFGKDGAFQRASRGFMGQSWDGGDIAFDSEMWHALGELLYPGAFMFIYAGTRTYHRVASAVEEAGFIIHPAIGWITSQGFPKATRVDTQIDRRLGAERAQVGEAKTGVASGTHKHTGIDNAWGYNDAYHETAPATPLAKTWAGHRYGLLALKPAFEFILCAQRPYEGKPIDNILESGAGALNIDGGRISGEAWEWGTQTDIRGGKYNSNRPSDGHVFARNIESNPDGRWPSNIVMSHLPECVKIGEREETYPINRFTDGAKPFGNGAGHEFETEMQTSTVDIYRCAPGCPVQRMNEQSSQWNDKDLSQVFYTTPPTESEDMTKYVPKVTPEERDAGCDNLEEHDKNNIYGDGLNTATKIRTEEQAINGVNRGKIHNTHPTLKPIELNRWLATLLLPPSIYTPRRLLVPFAGVLSEAIGGELAGWEETVAVELTPEYIPIGKARAEYWTSLRSSGADASKLGKAQLSFDELMNKDE